MIALALTVCVASIALPDPHAADGVVAPANAGSAIVLHGAHVLAPEGDRWIEGVEVVIEGERITVIRPARAAAIHDTDEVLLDLTGLYLVRGLIDLHTHLCLHPYDETSWDDQVLRESLELRTIRAVAAARATLEAGFTTVRELGTEGAGYADVALRDAIRQGIAVGPRIFASTRALVASGCYGPMGFDPRVDVPKGAQVADGVEGLRVAVRQQVAAGADWIKLYADYRRHEGDPATPTYSLEEMRAAVEEAHSAGKPVAAHASTDEGIRRAVMAGVTTIEHGTNASDETLKLMAEHEVVLCPTLAAAEAIARHSGWKSGDPDPARLAAAKATFKRALALGVPIANGSDAGVFRHGDNAREIELMIECGLSPADALRAATSSAARVLGKDKDIGRIAPKFIADLAAFELDPLAAPHALRGPPYVMTRGRAVEQRR